MRRREGLFAALATPRGNVSDFGPYLDRSVELLIAMVCD